jgi:hypothetical protein
MEHNPMKLTKRSFYLVALGILLLAFSNVVAQTQPVNQAGCALIDESRPAQFISYVGTSEMMKWAVLRLYNNTSCSIIVETDDKSPTRLNKLPDDNFNVETVISSGDEVLLPIHYLVQDRKHWRAPEPAYGWGDSVFTFEILAGKSAFFNVPLTYFRKRLDLVVPFSYSWERKKSIGMGIGGVVHRVYLLIEDVPETELRKAYQKNR